MEFHRPTMGQIWICCPIGANEGGSKDLGLGIPGEKRIGSTAAKGKPTSQSANKEWENKTILPHD